MTDDEIQALLGEVWDSSHKLHLRIDRLEAALREILEIAQGYDKDFSRIIVKCREALTEPPCE